MQLASQLTILSQEEEDRLHEATLQILEEIGVTVDNETILRRLAGIGGRIDLKANTFLFPRQVVESVIENSERFDWQAVTPVLLTYARTYAGWYLDPVTDQHRPCGLKETLEYFKVATHLGLSCDIFSPPSSTGLPAVAQVLYYNYFSLKFFGQALPSLGSETEARLALEMCRAYCAETGADLQAVCRHSPSLHLISPLRFASEEAKTYLLYIDNHLDVDLGNMSVIGSTGPVTLAGTTAVHLAQSFFINLLRRAFFGGRRFVITGSIAPLDMKTTSQLYARPEKPQSNIALVQMARRYGVAFSPHVGNADAKQPGPEAAAQKMMVSLMSLLTCGKSAINCGLLSIDEVYSPVQMVIDQEIASLVRRMVRGFAVTPDTLALDVVREETKPGGMFMASEHTATHYRQEIWEPRVFSREMFNAWQSAGGKTELDRARELVFEALKGPPLPSHISDRLEKDLLAMVKKASGMELPPVEAD